MSGEAPCPRCGGRTAAVSALYLAALEALSRPKEPVPEDLRSLLAADADLRGLLRVRALRRLVGFLSPPAGARRRTLTLHPDLLAGGFAAMVAASVAHTWLRQPAPARAGAAALVAAALLYVAFRGRVLRRHAAVLERERASELAVSQGVDLWMSLRCCLQERTVEGFGAAAAAPLPELQQRLAARVAAAAGSPAGARRRRP